MYISVIITTKMDRENLNLAKLMDQGEFLTVVQLHPPEEKNLADFAAVVDQLEENGITIFDINASRMDHRMNSFDVAARISQPGRIIIPHATARTPLEQTLQQTGEAYEKYDINHLLVVGGDKPAKGDFQTRASTIMASLADFRTESGKKKFIIAGAVNQNADEDQEGRFLKTKIKLGADFFMSQLVFDREQAEGLGKFYKKQFDEKNPPKPLLAGISALDKIGNVNGIVVPAALRQEEQEIGNNTKLLTQRRIERAVELVSFIRDNHLANGVYIAAPINNPAAAVDFVKSLNQ